MAGVPINFGVPTEGAIASYDWTDIAEGTGSIIFDGLACTATGGVTRHATKNFALSSNPGSHTRGSSFGGGATDTLDFRLSPFNTPRVIGGNFFTTYTHYLYTGGGANASIDVTIKIIKLSGAVETEMGTVTAATRSIAASVTVQEGRILNGTIAQTNFKIGDILIIRATVVTSGGGGGWEVRFYHDPADLYFKTSIPFKIDQ
jgi:hypothetical protein